MTTRDYRAQAVLPTMENLLLAALASAIFGFAALTGVLETHRWIVTSIIITLAIPAGYNSVRILMLILQEMRAR